VRTHVLSFHAPYRCASSGACCTSAWPIPVEPDVLHGLRSAVARGALSPARGTLDEALAAGPPAVLLPDAHGRCAFFETAGGHACAIHRRLGHDALPLSCRLFPRVCLLTPRGVSITLSHYCPTAAALLFAAAGPPSIVEDAPAFPAHAVYEGLDARTAAPPLLRPGVFLGWDAHARFERHAVAILGSPDAATPEDALARLAADAERLRAWTVHDGAFDERLDDVLARTGAERLPAPADDLLIAEVQAAIPEALRPRPLEPGAVDWGSFAPVVRRYLAGRAFASWASVQGPGLRTSVRALQAALAVLRAEVGPSSLDRSVLAEAIRRTDLRLVHLASPETLARSLGRCEERPRT
jgi:Fe-S-cluster containining protein